MKYLQKSFTMPKFEPNPKMCCEACVFGRGKHAEWRHLPGSLDEALAKFGTKARQACRKAGRSRWR
jgi:hypothetical protein